MTRGGFRNNSGRRPVLHPKVYPKKSNKIITKAELDAAPEELRDLRPTVAKTVYALLNKVIRGENDGNDAKMIQVLIPTLLPTLTARYERVDGTPPVNTRDVAELVMSQLSKDEDDTLTIDELPAEPDTPTTVRES